MASALRGPQGSLVAPANAIAPGRLGYQGGPVTLGGPQQRFGRLITHISGQAQVVVVSANGSETAAVLDHKLVFSFLKNYLVEHNSIFQRRRLFGLLPNEWERTE